MLLDDLEMPKSFIMTVNAGNIPEIIGHRTRRLAVGALLEKCAILLIFLDFLLDLQSYPQTKSRCGMELQTLYCSLEFECGVLEQSIISPTGISPCQKSAWKYS